MANRLLTLDQADKGRRELIFSGDGALTSVPVYDGAKIGAGHEIMGPAVIEETTATLVIQPGWTVELHSSASYVMKRVR